MIPRSQMHFKTPVTTDDVGRVFVHQDKLYRGIFPGRSPDVIDLFESGLINELIKENLFPNSVISQYGGEGFDILVEHEIISPVILPEEWTFSMLKEAAITVLRVRDIAFRYGYNMKDCHSKNILFDALSPKFVDLGTFIKCSKGQHAWLARNEFLRCYMYPLFIWNISSNFSRMSAYLGDYIPRADYLKIRYSLSRFLPKKVFNAICIFPELLFRITVSSDNAVRKCQTIPHYILYPIKMLANYLFGNFYKSHPTASSLENLKPINNKSKWTDYNSSTNPNDARFAKILELINTFCTDAITAVDIAGNQGFFSKLILENTHIKKCHCLDLDEFAIDIGYANSKAEKKQFNISYASTNFMDPLHKYNDDTPYTRFASDLVVCMALTHHLILGQKYSMEEICDRLYFVSKKYLYVEFMPLGLWSEGMDMPSDLPKGYDVFSFENTFACKFEIIQKLQLEKNRIGMLFAKKLIDA